LLLFLGFVVSLLVTIPLLLQPSLTNLLELVLSAVATAAGLASSELAFPRILIRYPKVYVIDWSKPPGSLTDDRVIVVEESQARKQAFHMGQQRGQDFDNWAKTRKIPVIAGEGDYHEFLMQRGITCTHERPTSVDWLDSVLGRKTARPD
jgi:hypothetical protein